MEIKVYRIVGKNRIDSAFDGEGSRVYGGRWNNKGISAVYTSDSLALSSLETIIHLPTYDLLENYVYFRISLDTKMVYDSPTPVGWDERPNSSIARSIGDEWVTKNTSPAMKVPSILVPESYNFIINIHHPDYSDIRIDYPKPLIFDSRLKK